MFDLLKFIALVPTFLNKEVKVEDIKSCKDVVPMNETCRACYSSKRPEFEYSPHSGRLWWEMGALVTYVKALFEILSELFFIAGHEL